MTDLRLNLGCGTNAPDGWTNIDRSPSMVLDRLPGVKPVLHRLGILQVEHLTRWPASIVRHDMTKRLPFPDMSASAIYSSHALEHIYLNEAQAVLVECYRVLKRDGILRLALPDAEQFARELIETSDGETFNAEMRAHPLTRPTAKGRVIGLFGASVHRWQPTRSVVWGLLHNAGFRQVEERQFLEGRMPRLSDVEHRERSMFVEACR
jgi:predicted SAM-dependent methyltransferase